MTVTIHRRKPPRDDPQLGLLRDRVFGPLAKWERFKRITEFEVPHNSGCGRYATIAYQSVAMSEIPPTIAAQVVAFRHLIRGARVEYRMHIAKCAQCDAVKQRPSLYVEAMVDGFSLSREFAV